MPGIRVLLVVVVALAVGGASISQAAPGTDPVLVQVFFSRNPDSLNDFTAVFPVTRDVPGGPGIMESTVAALIAGPTAAEQGAGLFSDFRGLIVGSASNCKGLDFTLMVVQGRATVQICRATASAGVGQDARAQSEIEATLMQFPGVTRVIVLNSAGRCLFDQSGLDLCLAP